MWYAINDKLWIMIWYTVMWHHTRGLIGILFLPGLLAARTYSMPHLFSRRSNVNLQRDATQTLPIRIEGTVTYRSLVYRYTLLPIVRFNVMRSLSLQHTCMFVCCHIALGCSLYLLLPVVTEMRPQFCNFILATAAAARATGNHPRPRINNVHAWYIATLVLYKPKLLFYSAF